MFRFLHAADVHLDSSPNRGLESYDGAPVDEIRGATRRGLENLTRLAIDQEVDFVLIAGDLYDGDWKDHNTGLFFTRQMTCLKEAGIPVVLISGNHDAANKMTRSLRLPDNVTMLSHTKPQSLRTPRLDELGVVIHGQSFSKRDVTDNLALRYPDRVAGAFNIGVLHTALTGAEGHESYAPCSLDDLRNKEYGYWALGHIHQRKVHSTDPPIVFSGNVQGRHIRETGEKGCYLVTVDGRGEVDLAFHPLDVFRWEVCPVSAAGASSVDDVLDRFALQLDKVLSQHDPLPVAVRVSIEGVTDVHSRLLSDRIQWTNEIRSRAIDRSGGRAWIEKVRFQTTPPVTADGLWSADGPWEELAAVIRELQFDDEQLRGLVPEFLDLNSRLPTELRQGDDGLRADDPSWMREVLAEAEALLMNATGEEPKP